VGGRFFKFRIMCKKVVEFVVFDYFIMSCIIGNIIVLALTWYLDSGVMESITGILNNVFTGIFTLEAMIKITAYGRHYFKNGWNILDFAVLIGTYI
jgi:voltage-dependent calcium channel L type alpha-1D